MRLLIVNPNTSAGVTRRIADAANAAARPGDVFTTVSAASGPALIVTEQDSARATAGVLDAVRAHAAPVDGIVLASFGDTGADAVRAARPQVPVMGIAAAAFAQARAMQVDYAIVTFSDLMVPALALRARHHGAQTRLIRIAAAEGRGPWTPENVQTALADELLDLCLSCARDGAGAIVIGGGPLAGLARKLSPDSPVPLIDGTEAAIEKLRSGTRALSPLASDRSEGAPG